MVIPGAILEVATPAVHEAILEEPFIMTHEVILGEEIQEVTLEMVLAVIFEVKTRVAIHVTAHGIHGEEIQERMSHEGPIPEEILAMIPVEILEEDLGHLLEKSFEILAVI